MSDPSTAISEGLAPARRVSGAGPVIAAGCRNTILESLGVHLPPGVASTSDVLAGCRKISRFQRFTGRIEKLTGIKRRRLASDSESASEMARKAIQECLSVSRCRPADIDLLICCGISRYQAPNQYAYEPAASLALSAHFPFRNAFAFDIANGCAGMFTAIAAADSLIKAGLVRVALIVSAEHITDLMNTAQKEVANYADSRFACLTLGDAAAALILKQGSDDRTGFHALELYTAGRYSEFCVAKPSESAHGGIIMYTESAKLFEVAEKYSVPDAVRMLDSLRWGREELNHLISHQTAQGAIDQVYGVNRVSQREVLHEGNVINNLAERGNTASTTHFVALWDKIHSGRIQSGDRVLFAIQGSGMTIGTAAYTLDDLPDRVRTAPRNGHARPIESLPGRMRANLRTVEPRVRIESFGIANGGSDSSIRLAQRAMDDCLSRSAYAKEDIEVLIYAGVHREEFIGEPAIAALIAGRSGMNETAGLGGASKKTLAFDVCNGTMGFLQACYLGAGMIRSGQARRVMIAVSEVEPNATRPEWDQLGIATAGSAVILDSPAGGRSGFGDCVFESFVDHIEAYTSWVVIKDGMSRMHVAQDPELENIYLKCIPETVDELMKSEGLRMDDIKVVLPPQISSCLIPRLAEALQVETGRFAVPAVDSRSLSSSSLVYSLLNTRCGGRVVAGDIGLMISVGSGLQVGAATYRF
jgi:3-oxoacyl-[acyl-carrier-protein] synthase III